jgi:hypothetical protein
MNTDQEVTTYLEALALELTRLGVSEQYHILISGGAWMLLQRQRRATEDIDFALLATAPRRPEQGKLIRVNLQRKGEIANRGSTTRFSQAVRAVASAYGLADDWINDESAVYLYDDAPLAEASFWRDFQQILFVYLPSAEYVFSLKIASYRRKDQSDVKVLIEQLGIKSREQAQAICDKYLLPEAQTFWEVPKKLRRIFRNAGA